MSTLFSRMNADNHSMHFKTIINQTMLLTAIFGPIIWSSIALGIISGLGTIMILFLIMVYDCRFSFPKKMLTFLYVFTLVMSFVHYRQDEIGAWFPVSILLVGVCVAVRCLWFFPAIIENSDDAESE